MPVALAIAWALVLRVVLHRTLRMDGLVIRAESFLIGGFLASAALPLIARRWTSAPSVVYGLWLVLMIALAASCLLNARLIPGFRLMALGVAANVLVIALNRGMPVLPSVALALGSRGDLAARLASDVFHVIGHQAHLPVLADAIPLPGPRPLMSLVSIGDLLMLLGVVTVLLAAPPTREQRERRRTVVGGHATP